RTARSATDCASRSCRTGWVRSTATSPCTRRWRLGRRGTGQTNEVSLRSLREASCIGPPPGNYKTPTDAAGSYFFVASGQPAYQAFLAKGRKKGNNSLQISRPVLRDG